MTELISITQSKIYWTKKLQKFITKFIYFLKFLNLILNFNFFKLNLLQNLFTYLAKSSLRSLTSSSAVHWSDRVVKPQMSANKMLKTKQINFIIKKYLHNWNIQQIA